MSIRKLIMAVGLAAFAAANAGAQVIGGDVTMHDIDRDDDLSIFAGDISISGRIGGDVEIFGGEITVDASIGEDARLVGGSVHLSGSVVGDVEAIAGNVEIRSDIAGNAELAGGLVNIYGPIGGATSVGAGVIEFNSSFIGRGDIEAIGEEIVFRGVAEQNVDFTGEDIMIYGRIDGDLSTHAEHLTIGPNAVIIGNLMHRGPDAPEISPEATITGSVSFSEMDFESEFRRLHDLDFDIDTGPLRFVFGAAFVVSAFLLGLLVIALAPRSTARIAGRFREKPALSGIIGLALFAFSPMIFATLFVLLLVTVIGIPLALLLATLYFPFLFLAYAFGAIAVGDMIFNQRRRELGFGMRALSLLVVLFAAAAIGMVPFLGFTAGLILMCIGLGAWAMSFGKSDRETAPPAAA